ncbi:DUF2637 domain-containing protein [Streptomyces inhibens]|uniref:DUF2637 domain-containing protein n=1 Tax=Streptomyces inhibens TaxID=2293571 RepID=UPI001EE6B807|nr:DUF2637 domain-containing protein [Streptomyces inhibens]UKY49882.1 DUF2637 domain-containing protein [Streptomyces inhibens]
MKHIAPLPARITGWDRAAIVALGGAGCALSYDALQQMAVAIHIRGFLTYVFPLVIDGFIAYGVRALLVLRSASLAARCYVWMLFGTATAASIWANSLHAVRLNQQQPQGSGLRLGDVTVGILSTLAPLALAGAVHLYILIARRVTKPALPGQPDTSSVRTDRVTADRRDTPVGQAEHQPAPVTSGHPAALSAPDTNRPAVTVGHDTRETAARAELSGQQEDLAEPESEHDGRTADLGGHPVTRPASVTRLHVAAPPATEPETHPVTAPETSDNDTPDTDPVTDNLLLIARQAVTEAGKTTRQVVADAIRGQNLPLANDRLTDLMQQLRAEVNEGSATRTG